MKKAGLLLTIILISSLSATAFEATLEPVSRTASPGSPAEFDLIIDNTGPEESFRISSIQSPPPTGNWFSYGSGKSIPAGENDTIRITITPPENSVQFNYRFTVNVRSRSDELKKVEDYFRVDLPQDLNIIDFGANSSEVDPGDEIEADITVKNTAPSNIENYAVSVNYFDQTREKQISELSPGDLQSFSFSLKTPENTSPGRYNISFDVRTGENTVQTSSTTISVSEIQNVVKDRSENTGIFQKEVQLSAENHGNAPEEVLLSESVPSFFEPLIRFERQPGNISRSDSSVVYEWRETIRPGETTSVGMTVLYWPPMLLTALIVVGILGVRKFTSRITIQKTTRSEEGEITVHLEIENRKGTKLSDVEITDFVPNIAKVDENFSMTKPVLSKTEEGTRMSWKIDELEPGEERVLEYRIKPLFEVDEGTIVLDSAKVKSDGQEIAASNRQEAEFRL